MVNRYNERPKTERLRKVMILAGQEARKLNHAYFGTEHALLGLVREDSGIVGKILRRNFGVGIRKARNGVKELTLPSPSESLLYGAEKLPQTDRARRLMYHAIEEAESMGCNYVGTEHLGLSFFKDEHSIIYKALTGFGVDPQDYRKAIFAKLSYAP